MSTIPQTRPPIALASARMDRALASCRAADDELVTATLRLLCLVVREAVPAAVAINLQWSDQGDFLNVHELVDVTGTPIEWDDDECLAANLEGHTERCWAPFMTADGNHFDLAIAATLEALESQEPRLDIGLRGRVEQVLAEADAIEAAWELATVTDSDPLAKVWQADDDARRDLAHGAVEVLREVRAATRTEGVDPR